MTTLVMKTRTLSNIAPPSLLPGEIAFYAGANAIRMWVGDAAGVPTPFGEDANGFVKKTGDTMSGALNAPSVESLNYIRFTGDLTLNSAGTFLAGASMRARVEAAGTSVPQTYSIITREKGDARYLALAGGTLTGFLTLHAKPTSALHAASKNYVDDLLATYSTTAASDAAYVNVSGDTMTGPLTLPNSDPTVANHASRKSYVDAQVATRLTQAAGDARYSLLGHTHLEAQVTNLNRLRYLGDWVDGMTVVTNDIVVRNGIVYVAIGNPSGGPPGGNWRMFGRLGAGVSAQDAAPSSPNPGDLWFRTTSPVGMFIWYVDANSSQWVATDQASTLAAGFIQKVGDSMSGQLSLLAGDPTAAGHAARKAYVDAQVATRLTQAQADVLYMPITSDITLKKSIQPMVLTEALNKIMGLKPKTYEWREPNGISRHEGTIYGVIAQDVEKVVPSATIRNGAMLGVDGLGLIGLLIGAVQQLNYRLMEVENGPH